MANISASKIKHATLGVNTADVVTFSKSFKAIEVLNRGSVEIYFRVDGTNPTIGGDDAYVVMPGAPLQVPSLANPDVVRLIASASCAYSVTGVN
jgi:hypothetical protein